MLPFNELSSVSIQAPFLSPDDERVDPMIAKELGGIALSDPSLGLQVQTWTARYEQDNIVLRATTVGDSVLFQRPDVVEIDLAFDQNMRPAIAFTQLDDQGDPEGWLWWFSTLDNNHIFSQFPSAYDLRLTMDDKRDMSDGQNDIILAYLKDDNLYFRAQRDRFGVEYLLRENVGGRLKRFGMNEGLRLQFEILLFKTAPDLILEIPADDDYTIEGLSFMADGDVQFEAAANDLIEIEPRTVYRVDEDAVIVVQNEKDPPCP